MYDIYSDMCFYFSHDKLNINCVVHLFLAYMDVLNQMCLKLMLCHMNSPEVVELKCILHPAVENCQKLFKFCT